MVLAGSSTSSRLVVEQPQDPGLLAPSPFPTWGRAAQSRCTGGAAPGPSERQSEGRMGGPVSLRTGCLFKSVTQRTTF